MLEDILLLSGNDIPFYSANVMIHQPRIKEIAFVGEENFFTACQLLNISKELVKEEEQEEFKDANNFDLLMSILFDETLVTQRLSITMLLSLLFPQYEIKIKEDGFHLKYENQEFIINRDNFEEFQSIVSHMFMAAKSQDEVRNEFNPVDERARMIAEKLQRGRQKLIDMQNKTNKVAILSRYISILSVGLQKDMALFFDYTVYQLYDEFKRYQMYQAFDINLKARMAGATDLEDVENWMEDIHPETNK